MPHKLLVVEDSPLVMKIIRHVLAQSQEITPLYADSFAEARSLIGQNPDLFAAMVDLNLPDAPDGEVVDFALARRLPTLVLTASFDAQKREQLLAKGIVDYVTKEGRYSYSRALDIVHRLIRNRQIQVLVVDDSAMARKNIANLLKLHLYQVLEAEDGAKAIKLLLENPDIKLLITDYNMPRMDGFELVKNIRVTYEKSDLVIVGISSETEAALSAKFIKAGANDFLKKPFDQEEFFCRITHNIEMIEMIEAIRDAAYRDDLTGAYNRRYFFSQGSNLLANACEKAAPLAAAVIDLDNFREVNDSHGNDVGDQAMIHFTSLLMRAFDRFLLARAGGEEFFALMPGLPNDKALALLEKVRQLVVASPFEHQGQTIGLAFSAGVSNHRADSLDKLISSAYACLGRAKNAGGDLVMGDED